MPFTSVSIGAGEPGVQRNLLNFLGQIRFEERLKVPVETRVGFHNGSQKYVKASMREGWLFGILYFCGKLIQL